VQETRDDYPFGLPLPQRYGEGSPPTREDYTGHERDAATGLHYAGARYYMSALGRWTANDPLADKYPGWSPYNYVGNNSTTAYDPNGEYVVRQSGRIVTVTPMSYVARAEALKLLGAIPALAGIAMQYNGDPSYTAGAYDYASLFIGGALKFRGPALRHADRLGKRILQSFGFAAEGSLRGISLADLAKSEDLANILVDREALKSLAHLGVGDFAQTGATKDENTFLMNSALFGGLNQDQSQVLTENIMSRITGKIRSLAETRGHDLNRSSGRQSFSELLEDLRSNGLLKEELGVEIIEKDDRIIINF
jgi:RHS repeat-associated protein